MESLEAQYSPQSKYTFSRKDWRRPGGGGGRMAILEGSLFEKAGVNVSTVYGHLTEDGSQKPFWASGLSLVMHPRSPHIPAIHMNTRMMETDKTWFGGGIDLNPTFPETDETGFFHAALQKTCNSFDKTYYPTFKKEADDYFFIPHRQAHRGVGGVFYDNLQLPFETGFQFTKAIGNLFAPLYTDIVQRKWKKDWTELDRKAQLVKRGHYAEFNLLYDRGTAFGLKTQGATDAIFMAIPPLAAWPSPLSET